MSTLSLNMNTQAVAQWLKTISTPSSLPISFGYGEATAKVAMPDSWQLSSTEGEDNILRHIVTDPQTGLEVCFEAKTIPGYPAIEWVVYFTNQSAEDTPVLVDIQALDAIFPLANDVPATLHHARGSQCKIDDFEPLQTTLPVGGAIELGPQSGRSSDGVLPFFNLETDAGGVIIAVGWTGNWKAQLIRDETGIRLQAGMRKTHLKLLPGETIRTPRMLLMFWEGDRVTAHNLWRRLMLEHYSPTGHRTAPRAPASFTVWGESMTQTQLEKIQWVVDNDLNFDCFWIDAGWHGDGEFLEGSNVFNSQWGAHVGNWWPNKTTYPDGLKPIGDKLREVGLGFVLWLEPERVFRGTWFVTEHPEWVSGPIGDNWLLDLGNPEARDALTDLVSNLISEGGITVYRQDFNFEPAPYWEANDAPDRQGISEIKHIEGLYYYWDELRRRNPGLLIDNCSSGGRRIDLETNSRSIPLWRSDFQCYPNFDPLSMQAQNHGIAPWVPLATGCFDRVDTYAARSAMGSGVSVTTDIYDPRDTGAVNIDWLKKTMEEQQLFAPYFLGDFYPLVNFSLATDAWAAWQYDCPEEGKGAILAYRRQDSPYCQIEAKLQGLNAEAMYEITSMDGLPAQTVSGAELMASGFIIEINQKPAAQLYLYKRLS